MSGTDPLAALRHAATVLLAEAPLPVVRATLRTLLADTEAVAAPPPARPNAPAAPPPPRKPRLQPKATPKLKPTDGEWDARRRAIRAAMLARGVGYQDLADQFGVAAQTLRHAVGRREPPTRAMRQRLEAWLKNDPAPAVAAEPPFRPNGAGRLVDAAARTSAG
jgi:hypothetical protein